MVVQNLTKETHDREANCAEILRVKP